MGSALSSTGFEEDDTKGRNESVDPVLEKLRNLHVVTPILKAPTGDSTLTDLLLRRSPSQSVPEALDPSTTSKLFALYQEWQRITAANIAKNQVLNMEHAGEFLKRLIILHGSMVEACRSVLQILKTGGNLLNETMLALHLVEDCRAVNSRKEELGYKIIGVEELSMKLLQRLNYAGRVLESSATHLKSVHALQVEVAEMKRSLTETIENYEGLCHKVESMGLHKNNIRPVSISNQTHYGSRAKTDSGPETTIETSSEHN